MKYAQYTQFGDPRDVINILEKDAPAPGPGQVTIDVEAAPIHLADLYCLRGRDRFVMDLPAIPGFEGIGLVRELGDGVEDFRVGERVFFLPTTGAWTEVALIGTDHVFPAPAGDASTLSLLPINPPTSYLILEDFGDLQRGDWVIQNAANSNCGRYLISLAKRRGIRTVNIVRRPELIEDLKDIGADVVLVDGDDLPERVSLATGNAEISLAVDAVNGMATSRLADCIKDDGTILAYGVLTGEHCMVPSDVLFLRNITLKGFWTIRQMQKRSRDQQREIYNLLANLMIAGDLPTRIAATYPLENVKDAVEHAGRKGADRDGKVILTMTRD